LLVIYSHVTEVYSAQIVPYLYLFAGELGMWLVCTPVPVFTRSEYLKCDFSFVCVHIRLLNTWPLVHILDGCALLYSEYPVREYLRTPYLFYPTFRTPEYSGARRTEHSLPDQIPEYL
jgi:hypothetical protein